MKSRAALAGPRQRARAYERDRRERIARLKRLTPRAAARELEALLAFPWPRRRRKDPPVPRVRFVTRP